MPGTRNDTAKSTYVLPNRPEIGQRLSVYGQFTTHHSQVDVFVHEHGWKLEGSSRYYNGPENDFSAEIMTCGDCAERADTGLPAMPICLCRRELTDQAGHPTRHSQIKCHKPGHIEIVEDLATRIAGTYRKPSKTKG